MQTTGFSHSLTGQDQSWASWLFTYSGLWYLWPESSSSGSSVCTDDSSVRESEQCSNYGTSLSASSMSARTSLHSHTSAYTATCAMSEEPATSISSHPIRHPISRHMRRVITWLAEVTAVVGVAKLLPHTGLPIANHAVVMVCMGAACMRHIKQRRRSHDSARPIGITAVDLGLPDAKWLTPDIVIRLVAQTNGDLGKASHKAKEIHTWRQSQGLNAVVFPAHLKAAQLQQPHHGKAGGRRSGGWLARAAPANTPTCSNSKGKISNTPHQIAGGLAKIGPAATVKAVADRFPEVCKIVGITLVHVDDDTGMACLWIQGALLGYVRKGLQSLLLQEHAPAAATAAATLGTSVSSPSSSSSSSSQQASGEGAGWLRAITLHVALMSDWLWLTRLPGQPIDAGRFYQVVDLKGVNMSLLGDGLTVLKAIMAAAHNFPQRLKSTIVINPPPGLALAWSVISKLLPAPISAKIKIIRGSGKVVLTALSSFLPLDVIPASVGGPCTLPLDTRPAHQEVEKAMAQLQIK